MSEPRYILNKKAFAATRVMPKGVNAETKWRYIHVSPVGVTCTDTSSIIRVSLPKQDNAPQAAQVFTPDMFEPLIPKSQDETVQMPEGLEAKSNGQLAVPSFNAAIPDPKTQVASITLSAKALIEVLKAACEVTDHARQLVRLRLCGEGKNQQLRIDAHCDEDGQEFVGVMMGTIYSGTRIPGDPAKDAAMAAAASNESFDEKKLTLPMVEGRKFRD
jgi:hypothetical protein